MAKWSVKRNPYVVPKDADRNEWCIVQYQNPYGGNGEISTLVRLKYQWDAQKLQGSWKYVAEGLTEKQAMEFVKLF